MLLSIVLYHDICSYVLLNAALYRCIFAIVGWVQRSSQHPNNVKYTRVVSIVDFGPELYGTKDAPYIALTMGTLATTYRDTEHFIT